MKVMETLSDAGDSERHFEIQANSNSNGDDGDNNGGDGDYVADTPL